MNGLFQLSENPFFNVTLYSISCFRGLLTQQSIHCHKICPIFFSAMMKWGILRDTVWFPSLMGKREERKCNNYSLLYLICSPADVSSSSPLVSGQRLDSASWASDTVLVCRHPGDRRLELVSGQCTMCNVYPGDCLFVFRWTSGPMCLRQYWPPTSVLLARICLWLADNITVSAHVMSPRGLVWTQTDCTFLAFFHFYKNISSFLGLARQTTISANEYQFSPPVVSVRIEKYLFHST